MTKTALDLFSGTGSATQAFQESDNWKVFKVEKDPEKVKKYGADIEADILELEPGRFPNPDFIWASPPCTTFSIASSSHYWSREGLPAQQKTVNHIKLVYHTLYLIQELEPEYWFLENPRANLRNVMPFKPSGTVSYCQYGHDYMKPTDLYGKHPESMTYKKCQRNANCHINAKRNPAGSGAADVIDSEKRAMIPYELSKDILEAVEDPGPKTKQQRLKVTDQ